MATVEPTTPVIDLVKALKGSSQEDFAKPLAAEFKAARITHVEHIKNAPLRLKATHGADIYKVIDLVTAYYAAAQKEESPAEPKKSPKAGERS